MTQYVQMILDPGIFILQTLQLMIATTKTTKRADRVLESCRIVNLKYVYSHFEYISGAIYTKRMKTRVKITSCTCMLRRPSV